jgi:uncharacterized protein (TIGR02246 family)
MQILFLTVALVGLLMGTTVSPHAQGRAGVEEDLRHESLAEPFDVWAQRRMQAEAAIRGQIALFTSAFNEGDARGLAALYTRDAVLLPPTQTQIEGRDEITQFWQTAIGAGLADLVLAPVEIVVVNYTAYEIRTLTLSVPDEAGKRRPLETKSIVVWQEDWDGVWRLHRDIWTVMPPMPPLEETFPSS